MGKGKKLTEYECGQVYAYRQSDMSLREIARTISKSVKCFHSILKDTANYKNKSSAKRPKIISSSMERRLIKTVKADLSVTSAELKNSLQLSALTRTIRRYLQKNGFRNVKKNQVPQITAKNKRLRFLFVKSYKTWNEEWKNIVFSDEKKLILMDQMVTNDIGSVTQKQSFSRRPSGGGGVMAWGAISYNGKMVLQEVTGRMNAEGYVRMLENSNLKEEGRRLAGSN